MQSKNIRDLAKRIN